MDFLYALCVLVVVGAILQYGILFSLAVGIDAMLQDIIWDDTLGVTISSRCGLAQRAGVLWPSKVVNFIMRSPTHCQDAITYDIARAKAALLLLESTSS